MFNFNSIVESTSQLAVFTFDRNNLTVDFYVNAGRNNDRCFSNTRHFFLRLGYVADNFATKTSLARCTISHNTFRGRNNCDTQTRHNFRQLIFTFIDAQTWAADTLNAFYNSFALEILQSKFQFRLGVAFNFKIFNKTFFLQHVGDCHFQLGGRHGDRSFVRGLTVTDTGQHIRDRILHAHLSLLP
ncbi:Hypothetical protein c4069 [Escherichia coli CFT073]|uniref:Uncharacterized protein n=2 Tax=Escherichia coli TaxID=562 RepID=A0A0H2VE04_ECOL6|nr:Hypothetical protein c4069 [Escherichia coli CFT073]ABE09191.1 hypothetical protein UTI89_C3754 [Escherichia coli UTI89]